MDKAVQEAIEELKQQGKEVYGKIVEAYEKKDWLNYAVLADQVKFIKEDIAKLQVTTESDFVR